MKNSIIKCLSVCVALLIIATSVPMVAHAAGHVHDFAVTTYFTYTYVDNNYHSGREYHRHTCSCGYSYLEHHDLGTSSHLATPGSAVNLGTTIGGNGEAVTTYRYTCRQCNHTYTRSVTSG